MSHSRTFVWGVWLGTFFYCLSPKNFRLGNFTLGTSTSEVWLWNCLSRTLPWEHSLGELRLQTSTWILSSGYFRLGSFVGIFRLGVAWWPLNLRLGGFRLGPLFSLGTVACNLLLGFFRLGPFVWDFSLGNEHGNIHLWIFVQGLAFGLERVESKQKFGDGAS